MRRCGNWRVGPARPIRRQRRYKGPPRNKERLGRSLGGSRLSWEVSFTVYPARSVHQFELARFPSLVEPRLQWAIETNEDVPAFAGNGLHPVGFMSRRRGWAEPDIDRGVGIDDEAFLLTADAGELLVGLEHRTGLVVVGNEGPEVLGGDVGRQVDFVGLAAVERVALRIGDGGSVLRALAHNLRRHGGRDNGGVIDEVNACI